jgi:ABC-2 type transport system ATP-binding protein
LASEGRTVFLSSHLMSEMAQTAEHLLVIGRGRIIADASVDEIVAGYTSTRVRVRAVAQDELVGLLVAAGGRVDPSPDGAVTVVGLHSAAIGGIAAARGLALVELTPEGASLEEAFLELTHHDTDYRAGSLT